MFRLHIYVMYLSVGCNYWVLPGPPWPRYLDQKNHSSLSNPLSHKKEHVTKCQTFYTAHV